MPPAHSPQPAEAGRSRALLAWRAATLDERLTAARARADAPRADVSALAPWARALAPKDAQAFARRLAWDGLDAGLVLAALADVPAEGEAAPPASWTAWLDRFAEAAASPMEQGLDPGETGESGPRPEPPFVELWTPLVTAVTKELRARAGTASRRLSPAALAAFQRRLRSEMSAAGELAVFQELHARAIGYDRFVRGTLADGYLGLFDAYPVLARQIAILAETWTASTVEMLSRLERDLEAVAGAFAGGKDPGGIAAARPALSDRHHGGRRVAVLTFASGLRLVYKPREIAIEQAFQRFLAWCGERGLEPRPRPLAMIARDGYGWVEHASEAELRSKDEVEAYYGRAGSLLALAHLLRARDLHMDNVVATAEGPVLVDTEAVLQPVDAAEAAAAGEPAATDRANARLRYSCLATGLLTFLQTDAGGAVFDIGGLRGEGGQKEGAPRRVWRALRTDAIHHAAETGFAPGLPNRVRLGGVVQKPEWSADALRAGFASACRFVLARRDEMLAADGPLAAFAGLSTRVVFRPTHQYAALQQVLASPRYQRTGYERSMAVDSLNRVFGAQESRPALWPLVGDERRALDGLDIPRFSMPVDATEVPSASGEAVRGHFVRSGMSAVREAIERLAEPRIAEEIEVLDAVLSSALEGEAHAPAPGSAGGHEDELADGGALPDDRALVQAAEEIGDTLLRRAIRGEDGALTWVGASALRLDPAGRQARHDLYDGTAGIGLFLSALAAVTGEARWAAGARGAAATLAREIGEGAGEGAPLGAGTGIGSRVWTLTWMGRLLGDERGIALARLAARGITPAALARDSALDVAGGTAGALLGLVALHEACGDDVLLEQALACGLHLLEARVETGPGAAAWPGPGGRALAGFAHGASGIACALARLAERTDEPRWGEAVAAARRHERSLFVPAEGNWRLPGEPGPSRVAWCHGAPGVGLARAESIAVAPGGEVAEEIEVAMATTARGDPTRLDHLCCGNLGRSDVLLTVGRRRGRGDLVEQGRALARAVAARARRRGHWGIGVAEFEGRAFRPGFFQGLSGIGYQLLRTVVPGRLPSVLAFEARLSIGRAGEEV